MPKLSTKRIFWAAAGAIVLIGVFVVLLWPAADWMAHHDVRGVAAKDRTIQLQTARDAARGRLTTVATLLLAVGALFFTGQNFVLARRQNELNQQTLELARQQAERQAEQAREQADQARHQAELGRRTVELTEQGQVTERYTKAIEQIGSPSLDVRVGGIYALERIARDSERDHPAAMEVLAAFIRRRSTEKRTDSKVPDEDVQAAFAVIARRDPARDRSPISMVNANLASIRLWEGDLSGTMLAGADLTNAALSGITLNNTNLVDAVLVNARLREAKLIGSAIYGADFTNADLTDATLFGTDLTFTELAGAYLSGAKVDEDAKLPEGWKRNPATGHAVHDNRPAPPDSATS